MSSLFQAIPILATVVKILIIVLVILGLVVLVAGLVFILLGTLVEIKKMWRELKDERKIKETIRHPTTIDQL